MNTHGSFRPRARRLVAAAGAIGLVLAVVGTTMGQASAATGPTPTAAATAGQTPSVPHRDVPASEQRAVGHFNHEKIAKKSKPVKLPTTKGPVPNAPVQGADGPAVEVDGALPTASGSASAASSTTTTATAESSSSAGSLWPGSSTSNPNRQIGKLYFDINPSSSVTDWRHCTGTAINSENKSTVLTAGHCVYDFSNRRWYTNLWFYPGYENGKNLGAWPVRNMATTNSYYNYGRYADDMAIVLVKRDSAGVPLVNRVGGHGIAFNQSVNVFRTSLGYPVTDSRWPGFTASGEDLHYCQGTDSYYSSGTYAGQMLLNCRMTGGASGGPWLSGVGSNWLGTAISVNSNKGGVGTAYANYMFAPYMGQQEVNVFQAYRAA